MVGHFSLSTKHRICREEIVSGISRTETDQPGSLCGKDDCFLNRKGGVWICCTCKFGCKGKERSRNYECANAACGHEACDNCLKWTRENVQALIDAENGDPYSSPELSSPSEQEYWDSDKSDAIEESDHAQTSRNNGK